MKENKVKTIWAAGEVVVNGWLTIPSSFSAEVMAQQGFDSIVVDLQHGAIDYQTAFLLIQAISTTQVISMVRVPWNDPGLIMKVLDAGAFGVICPMINNPEEAEKLVQACKYPPRGFRSCGPVRAKYNWGHDYLDYADATTIVMPQIETREAVDKLDQILEVDGIDAVYVGPSDLAFGLGSHARRGQKDPQVVEAKHKIAETCNRHDKPAGIHTPSAKTAFEMSKLGYSFLTIASDDRMLAAKATSEIGAIRKYLEEVDK